MRSGSRGNSVKLMKSFACNNKSMSRDWTQGERGKIGGWGAGGLGRIGLLIGCIGLNWRGAGNHAPRATTQSKAFF
jgi:hypothetical protein